MSLRRFLLQCENNISSLAKASSFASLCRKLTIAPFFLATLVNALLILFYAPVILGGGDDEDGGGGGGEEGEESNDIPIWKLPMQSSQLKRYRNLGATSGRVALLPVTLESNSGATTVSLLYMILGSLCTLASFILLLGFLMFEAPRVRRVWFLVCVY